MLKDEKLVEFMTNTAKSLGRIEANQGSMSIEIGTIKSNCQTCTTKIPLIESGLNNHLSSHNQFKKSIVWPIVVGLVLTIVTTLAAMLKWLFGKLI